MGDGANSGRDFKIGDFVRIVVNLNEIEDPLPRDVEGKFGRIAHYIIAGTEKFPVHVRFSPSGPNDSVNVNILELEHATPSPEEIEPWLLAEIVK